MSSKVLSCLERAGWKRMDVSVFYDYEELSMANDLLCSVEVIK